MSTKLYDDALVKRLQDLVADSNIRILKPDETTRLFEEKADETKDNLKLPLICLRRRGFTITNANKQPKSFDGIKIRAYDNEGHLLNKFYQLNAIPITINYQLDIYTLNLEECEDYCREFIFNFVNNPTITVVIPYQGINKTHKSTIHVEEEAVDNSDIRERLFPSQFTRYTLNLVCDDAYLFSVPKGKLVEFQDIGVVVQDRQSHEEIERINVLDKK